MSSRLTRLHHAQRGVTLIELLVALAVFAMFVLMIDAVFSSARTSSRKTEIAADVQQNARVAADRITRELHETNINEILVDSTPGQSRIVFKSARLSEDNSIFCLYVRSTSDPTYMWKLPATLPASAECFTFSGGNITPPPYVAPEPTSPRGTYTPIWQRSIGYYLSGLAPGPYELRRVVTDLTGPSMALTLPTSGGDVVAAMIESLDIPPASGGVVSVSLKARGTEVVQGRAIPAQEILLPGQSKTRN